MHLMREVGGASLADVGEYFGGRTHSTVLHSIRRIVAQLKRDETLRLQFEQVCRQLRRGGSDDA
jgi:chromosomal replication initiator protein